MRIRKDTSANYKAFFFNGKTIRQKLDINLKFGVPKNPEIEDVAINSKCFANCSYCYTSATKHGKNFENVSQRAIDVWGSLPENERPFQIAIGGAGEATIHPEFPDFVKTVKGLGILPNYTTNGMHLSEEVLRATEDYCGGVAVSYHPHIKKIFGEAINKLSPINVKLNVHVIVGSEESLNDLKQIYEDYKEVIDYFVILPYQAAGRGTQIEVDETWKQTFSWISTLQEKQQQKFAFGALFYEWLNKNSVSLPMSIYEPEIFSGYRVMDETFKTLRKSSYDLTEKI